MLPSDPVKYEKRSDRVSCIDYCLGLIMCSVTCDLFSCGKGRLLKQQPADGGLVCLSPDQPAMSAAGFRSD